MSNNSEKKVYRWKGKIVTKKVYEHRLAQQQTGLNRKKVELTSNVCDNSEENEETCAEGRRIVELKTLGEQLWCVSCKEALSLQYIESETRRGLGSQLSIRCHKCLLLNQVCTSKHVESAGDKRSIRFATNYKAVLGALHCGLGWTHLSKLCACLNIPCVDFKTYQKYEAEIGQIAEKIAKKSCYDAAALERKLTLEQIQNISKLLPETTEPNFLLPSTSASNDSNCVPEEESTSENITSFNDVVRILVSYDMGWSTRGSGRNYDSLNGFGAIIGYCSGLVLDYSTCNRKCRKCDNVDNPFGHNCRKNFYGSAKAMEAHVGKKLMVDSEVLKSNNVEVGVFIGDDDSSTIAACRAASNHQIIKQSDVNHLSGGVKKQLYRIEKSHKELTKDRINYLHRCFMYAVTQNRGNSKKMADAIRCIPHHAFNHHANCGEWCGYIQDRENYDHKVVPGGFQDQNLYEDLKNIFNQLAENAQKFSTGASSNPNESLNAMMMAKHPKSRCYSTTALADYRYACTIGQKNLGEKYTQEIYKTITLSPGQHHSRYIMKTQEKTVRRRVLIKTPEYKRRRKQLKANKSALRHRKEDIEGITYESNCALLSESTTPSINSSNISDYEFHDQGIPIILFDLETSGFERDCDILQIAAKYGNKSFDVYINPTRLISASATAAHGLVNCQGVLMHHGIEVHSVTMRLALVSLLEWLKSCDQKCYLAAHNLMFDGPRIFRAISTCSLTAEFSEVVSGFIDTLEVIRKVTGRKGKGACSIGGLSTFLNINTAGAHNAIYDCDMLNQILYKLNITGAMLTKCAKVYDEKVQYWKNEERASKNLLTLLPLQRTVGVAIRKRLAIAGCTLDILKDKINTCNKIEMSKFIQKELEKKGLKQLRPSTIQKIIDYFEK